ncbi:MAG: DciA family protein [Cyanobacteria bacterium J06638_22]
MTMRSLQQVLGVIEHQPNWQQRQHFQRLQVCWMEVVGTVVAAQTRPIALQRRVLQVATSSSAWAQNLMFERQRILEKLNAQLPFKISDIRFSTARWGDTSADLATSETTELWERHPSRMVPLSQRDRLPPASPATPDDAFQHWTEQIKARSHHLPACPLCHCPTPKGELERWGMCSHCVTKTW